MRVLGIYQQIEWFSLAHDTFRLRGGDLAKILLSDQKYFHGWAQHSSLPWLTCCIIRENVNPMEFFKFQCIQAVVDLVCFFPKVIITLWWGGNVQQDPEFSFASHCWNSSKQPSFFLFGQRPKPVLIFLIKFSWLLLIRKNFQGLWALLWASAEVWEDPFRFSVGNFIALSAKKLWNPLEIHSLISLKPSGFKEGG